MSELSEVMSVRAPAMRLSARGDALEVVDPMLVEHLGARALRGADEECPVPHVRLRDLHRLEPSLASYRTKSPPWLAQSLRESRWGDQRTFRGHRAAYAVAGVVVVAAPYSTTLADAMGEMSSAYLYSHPHRGWVLEDPQADAGALAEVLSHHDVEASPAVGALLEGRGNWERVLRERGEAAAAAGFALPDLSATTRTLKDHQAASVPVMAAAGATLLADQVGLGKGGQFVCGLLCLAARQEATGGALPWPAVVSVPKSLRAEIVKEILRWKPDAHVQTLVGTKSAPVDPDAQFVVLNHDLLAKRLPDILEAGPRAFVADESHVFKNESAQRTVAAQSLANAVRANTEHPYVVLASGTPFVNAPVELWPVLCVLGVERIFSDHAIARLGASLFEVHTSHGSFKRKLSPRRAFEIYFCDGHYDHFKAWHCEGATHTRELNRLLFDHVMIRRRKSDVIHPLPPLAENVVLIEPSAAQRGEYARLEQEFRAVVEEEARRVARREGSNVDYAVRVALAKLVQGQAIMQLTALRQHVAASKVEGSVAWIRSFMDGSLVLPGPDGVEVAVGDDPARRKLIVFAHHRGPRQALATHPDLAAYGVVRIEAGADTTDAQIQDAKARFQSDPHTRLIVCTMAAREGHTLTAASDVYLHEIPFAPSWIVQMVGRAWARISEEFEPHGATVHYAVTPGTVDVASVRRVQVKSAVSAAVIDAEGQDEDIAELGEESLDVLVDMLTAGGGGLDLAR